VASNADQFTKPALNGTWLALNANWHAKTSA